MTALGDMAWYSMRAVVEYLRPEARITKGVTLPERDPKTTEIVRASGLIAFDSGEVSTFDIGYTARPSCKIATALLLTVGLMTGAGVLAHHAFAAAPFDTKRDGGSAADRLHAFRSLAEWFAPAHRRPNGSYERMAVSL
jgi:hypothetical protein